jgi:two-component system OmpR family response regulator
MVFFESPEKMEETTSAQTENAVPLGNILVVEDGKPMSELLSQALTESGYTVSVAQNGYEGLRRAAGHDLLIVDVMMPIMNGFDMVRKLRDSGNQAPVLFLTAKNGPQDLVRALNLGGDDFLSKPFRLDELLARIKALLRRSRQGTDVVQFGDLSMDLKNRRVKRGEHTIILSNTEFELLKILITQQGATVSKHQLLTQVWEDPRRDDNVVEVYMNYLRAKLEAHDMPRLIQTVRGKGYVLESPHSQP